MTTSPVFATPPGGASTGPPPGPPAPQATGPAGPPPAEPGGDETRTGAVWVTALGAVMLFAAAAVFVAVRWNDLTDALKLAVLAAGTVSCLLGGRALKPSLPATAGVVFHLGAFLVPVNSAAVALHLDLSWPRLLLVEGVTAALTWAVLARAERSPILAAGAGVAAVVTAAGLSATLAEAGVAAVPTALLVALAAVVAELIGRHRLAIAWALVAGGAPVLALAERAAPLHTDVTGILGLTGHLPALAGLVAGALAAAVLARNARRRRDLTLVVAAAVALGLGIASSWTEWAPGTRADVVGVATLFLVVELLAAALRRDDFWGRPARDFAVAVELFAIYPMAGALVFAGVESMVHEWSWQPAYVLAGVIAAAGWVVADLRRRADLSAPEGLGWALLTGAGWGPATVGLAVSFMSGILAGGGPAGARVAVTVALAALLVISGRRCAHAVAAVLVVSVFLPASVAGDAVVAAVGLAGASILTGAAVLRARLAAGPRSGLHDETHERRRRRTETRRAWATTIVALFPPALAGAYLLDRAPVSPAYVFGGLVLTAWALAVVLDRAPALGRVPLAVVPRTAAVLVVVAAAAFALTPLGLVAVAGLAAGLVAVDVARLRRPGPLWALTVHLTAVTAGAALLAGASWPQVGVALMVLAAVATAAHLAVDAEDPAWALPLLGVIGTAVVAGVPLTVGSPANFATVILLGGGIALAFGAAHRWVEVEALGALLAVAGVWSHLSLAGIDLLDAAAAPVALVLAVAGWRVDRAAHAQGRAVTSWVTFAPAAVVLGGTALIERLAGGGDGHALVAGAVGVAAVVLGGGRRLVGPLVVGTVLLLAVTAAESLGVTRQVPTWAWLALGGAVLVGAGLGMERRETGPLETGRRLVDVVRERFS